MPPRQTNSSANSVRPCGSRDPGGSRPCSIRRDLVEQRIGGRFARSTPAYAIKHSSSPNIAALRGSQANVTSTSTPPKGVASGAAARMDALGPRSRAAAQPAAGRMSSGNGNSGSGRAPIIPPRTNANPRRCGRRGTRSGPRRSPASSSVAAWQLCPHRRSRTSKTRSAPAGRRGSRSASTGCRRWGRCSVSAPSPEALPEWAIR
jgi:hypothetical protein